MPRIEPLNERHQVIPEGREQFDLIMGSRKKLTGGPMAMMLHSPEMAWRTTQLSNELRFNSSLPGDVLELCIIIGARAADNEFTWSEHAPWAKDAGVSEAAIDAVGRRTEDISGLDDVEQLIIEFGNELMYDRDLSDVTFERAKALYGNRGAIEMSFLMGYYGMIGCLVRVAGMDPRPNGPRFPG
jgi:4-carboxymuconolactone decarboxylase